jgi:UDP-2,4-diacetamido-2,4,6-trideoxy-beta-L-altropyranose hydrolase
MKKKIIFRADGNRSIGLGHLSRCLAIAMVLKNQYRVDFSSLSIPESFKGLIISNGFGFFQLPNEITFLGLISGYDFVVLDGYQFNEAFEKEILGLGPKVILIDDLHNRKYYVDAIINHALGIETSAYNTSPSTQLFLGTRFLMLRPEILEYKTQYAHLETSRKSIFICMGGADPNNITLKVLKALQSLKEISFVTIVLGESNPNIDKIRDYVNSNQNNLTCLLYQNLDVEGMVKAISSCEWSICPASTTAMEVCLIGKGLITGYTFENQKGILNGLTKYGCGLSIGDFNSVSISKLANLFEKFIGNLIEKERLVHNQNQFFNGQFKQNLLKLFEELQSEKKADEIKVRKADINDMGIYFNWKNEPTVRESSLNSELVSWDTHFKWFSKRIRSNNTIMYIFENNQNRPIGQVRLDFNNDQAISDITIDPSFRGKSLGKVLILKAAELFFKDFPNFSIEAFVKLENVASYKSFINAGFSNIGRIDLNGIICIHLQKKSTLIN